MRYLTTTHQYIKLIIAILTLNLIATRTLQAQQFKTYIELGNFTSEINADTAYQKINSSYKTATATKDTTEIVNSLIAMSAVNRARQNYSAAFDNAGEALFLAEESNSPLSMAKAHEESGVLNFLFVQDELAGINFKESVKNYKSAYSNGLIEKSELFHPYYNLALYYNRIRKEDLALNYIDSCASVVDTTDSNQLYQVYINEKRAIWNSRNGNNKAALNFLHESASSINDMNRNSMFAKKHKSFLIVIYTSLGNIYSSKGELKRAKSFYEKALNIKDNYGEYTFYLSYVYSKYALILNTLGEHESAFQNLLHSKSINDKYLNPRNVNTQDFLKVKNRYSDQLQKRNEELSRKNLELAKNKQEILRFRIYFYVSILLLVLIGLGIRIVLLNIKHQRENELNQKEKELHQKKQEQTKELLEHKNKELTATMLQLIEKEEIIKTLSEHLEKSQGNSSTRALLSSIEKRSVSLWDAFNTRFIAQNEDFYERLKAKVPDLSSADLKICALIKLNFTGKEMAYLLGMSLGSVHVARHRVRKKMNIDRDINLTSFINSI